MKISIILFIVFFLFQINTFAKKKSTTTDIYCLECADSIGKTLELHNDTIFIHDTVHVSDIDGFLKKYGCNNLGTFARKYGPMKQMVDSINNLSEERLYYNYFLPKDHSRKLSTRFIVNKFQIKKGKVDQEELSVSDFVDKEDSVRNEILFTCKGADETDHFLQNPVAITQVISGMFTFMQEQETNNTTKIKGINLYFPDFTFRNKRALVQFVKSVRIVMDASHCFKPPRTRLNVTFLTSKGTSDLEKGFFYALMQEATEVICLHQDMIDSCYVNGNSTTSLKDTDVNLIDQIVSHYYIARYYTGPIDDISKADLICFSGLAINPYLQADYSENTWEIYLLLLLSTVLLIIVVVVLYYTCLPVSTFMNKYIESVVLVSVMMLLELFALAITTFQHMSEDDNFSQLQKHPFLLLSLPFVIVLIIPMFKGISKKRRIP